MNTVVESKPGAIQVAPTPAFDLTPQNFDQALRLADYLASSEMVPKAYRGRPGDCLIAMQWGFEVGLKPLQALQSIAAINGKPSLYGDAGKALLISHGCIIDEDDTEIVKKNQRARCKITRPGRPPVERTFSMADAETALLTKKDGPWKQYPYRQLAWRAFWFAARDAAADILRGMAGAEETMDYAPRDMGNADVVGSTPTVTASEALRLEAEAAAGKGLAAYQEFWKATGPENRKMLTPYHEANKATAAAADQARTVDQSQQQPATDAAAKPAAESTPAGGPAVTYAIVMDKLIKAKNLDALDVACDWIGEVADPEQRAELIAKYEERKASFVG